ncbi:pyruvate ferredoxin/flavodoxin oxidoreductase family protein [Mycobacterium xenopi 4042]|uniref:Pyruvate ferredoxin/flavodoxin oxidoreductase family protein n=1 Tax=Mycobacterium xenopi 4042 TaxID=1299334 RepID=X8ANK8_MYCXE|nr:pyruvate ferredoxin/flavodoxin oxidoreductase family protein [Mycobacterium xenopi 4042]
MQLTGDRFTSEAALFGNDLATQPNYPAEIRAPAGTLPGVSSFQIQIADYDILTAGDRPDVLVAMNPAALKANIADLPRGGMVIVNSDEFTKRNLAKVGYETNPLDNGELSDYVVHAVPMTTLTLGAVEAIGASKKDGQRAKNMFALGLLSWMYGRPIETSERFIREKFARKPDIAEANVLALKAGWNYGETTEAFGTTYDVSPAKLPAGNTGRFRATPRLPTASSPPASWQASQWCWAATRSPRPPTSCTSCRSTRTSTSSHSRPRTRSAESAPRWARPTAARSASPARRDRAFRSKPKRSASV